jgi:PQQ-dependent dehydrogenase (methanol/ethanol family)
VTYGLDYAEQRYSRLRQIDAANVNRLGLGWTTEIGAGGGRQEATPLVANGVMYVITNWSIVYALDARTGRELWHFDPQVDKTIGTPGPLNRVCCGVVNRGLALYEGRVFVGALDGRLIALDAATGAEVWSVMTVPRNQPYSITMAPRIYKGKVVVGNSGAEYPVRGYVSAYDARDGKMVWRFYTVPGDPSKPFEHPDLESAAKTWTGEWWKMGGGGTVWDALAFDPEADLLYIGVGNGGPWNRDYRSPGGGDNWYLASIVALRPDTGQYVWHYQTTPGDTWDYTAVQHMILADLRINGRDRKVIMQAPKNAFFYVIDRITGEFISAEPYVNLNWASGIDKSGRPIESPGARYETQPVRLSPSVGGGHNWNPMSFNPQTGLVYIPATNSGRVYSKAQNFVYNPGTEAFTGTGSFQTGVGGGGGGRGRGAGRGGTDPAAAGGAGRGGTDPVAAGGAGLGAAGAGNPGRGGNVAAEPLTPPMIGPAAGRDVEGTFLLAWDPVAQRERWRTPGAPGARAGGTLTTAANLVFYVTVDRKLQVYAADTGTKLHEIDTGISSLGPPITYALDGRQYVAFLGGSSAAGGPANAPRVMTFMLDGKLPLPGGGQASTGAVVSE